MNYIHRHEKSLGGIAGIVLTPAQNVASANFTLHDPSLSWPVTVAEGAARYTELTEADRGIPTVVHTLEFSTDRIDRRSDSLLRALAEHSPAGLAAVVTTGNGVRLLVGFSEEHGAERPLRLESAAADSGRIHTDDGREVIRLRARSTAKAVILD